MPIETMTITVEITHGEGALPQFKMTTVNPDGKRSGLKVVMPGPEGLSPDVWFGAGVAAMLRWDARKNRNEALEAFLRSGKTIEEIIAANNYESVIFPHIEGLSSADILEEYPEQQATHVLTEVQTTVPCNRCSRTDLPIHISGECTECFEESIDRL